MSVDSRARLKTWAKSIKTETYALYLAVRDPRTPWYARVLGACVVAYALSPIDLIPDFVPVIGYLDDIIIVPAGLWAVRRMIPVQVLADARERAADAEVRRNWTAAVIIVALWIGAIALAGAMVWRMVR
jgi:uncharacterized membrane protein YkvA (DUF1232 family)